MLESTAASKLVELQETLLMTDAGNDNNNPSMVNANICHTEKFLEENTFVVHHPEQRTFVVYRPERRCMVVDEAIMVHHVLPVSYGRPLQKELIELSCRNVNSSIFLPSSSKNINRQEKLFSLFDEINETNDDYLCLVDSDSSCSTITMNDSNCTTTSNLSPTKPFTIPTQIKVSGRRSYQLTEKNTCLLRNDISLDDLYQCFRGRTGNRSNLDIGSLSNEWSPLQTRCEL